MLRATSRSKSQSSRRLRSWLPERGFPGGKGGPAGAAREPVQSGLAARLVSARRGGRAARLLAVALALGFACLGVAGGPLAWASARPRQEATAPPAHPREELAARAPVTLELSSPYTVELTVGTWAPVSVSVANRQRSPFQGVVVLTAPAPEATSGQVCYPNGSHTVCWAAANLDLPAPYSKIQRSSVTYEFPAAVSPGSTRRFTAFVLAEQPGRVTAVLRSATGSLAAKASASLRVAAGVAPPALAVVTGAATSLAAVEAWARSSPAGPLGEHPEVQYLRPSQLPGEGGALGAFNAVLLDLSGRAGTGDTLSRAQGQALLDYAEAGGAVVVVGGTPSGLPPALVGGDRTPLGVPGSQPGTSRQLSVPLLRRLLGKVSWRSHYAGLPSLPAGAPRAPGWGGRFPEGAGGVATSGVVSGGGLLSPAGPGASMLGYLEQSLGAPPPSQAVVGLLLMGYVVVVGPASFLVVRLFRRRELAWVAVPSIAVAGAVALFVTGPGPAGGAMADQALVAQLSPGAKAAEVTSLGVVYLPVGGSHSVELGKPFSTTGLVGDLGAGAGARLTVSLAGLGGAGEAGSDRLASPGGGARSPGGASEAGSGGPLGGSGAGEEVTVSGARGSLAGWVASAETELRGSVTASASGGPGPGSVVSVTLANHLGAPLRDAEVVAASGLLVRSLGTLRPGAVASFQARVPVAVGGQELYAFALPPEERSASALSAATAQSLYDLGSVSSAEYGGAPVLVAVAAKRFLPQAFYAPSAQLAERTTDVVVVPLPVRSPGSGFSASTAGGRATPELALPARPLPAKRPLGRVSPKRPLARAPGPVQALWAAGATAVGPR